jgi:hypothetical protein
MATLEGLVVDGLALNDATNFALESLEMPAPAKSWEWVKASDGDGAILARPPLYENREVTARVRVVQLATADLALAKLGTLNDKLQEGEHNPAGITLAWTPADSTKTLTAYVLGGEVTGLPITAQGDDAGWFARSPVVTIKLTCKPFLYGAEITDFLDDFSTNTIGNYTFDNGAGTLSVSGGQLVPSSTAIKRLRHNGAYDIGNAWVSWKLTPSTTANQTVQVRMTAIDATTYLRIGFAAGVLGIEKVVAGSPTSLASNFPTTTQPPSGSPFWLRARKEGNVITAEYWTSAPTDQGTPSITVTHTLTGSDATMFGSGVAGKAGLEWTPLSTSDRADDFLVVPNKVVSTLPVATVEVTNVAGDVAAEARLVVTDNATQSRRLVRMGREWRYYPTAGPWGLLIDSDALVTAGFGGAQATRSGAYDVGGGNNIVRATLGLQPIAVCGTGNQPHVGSFRVFMRIWSDSMDSRIRLAWQDGDGPFQANSWVAPQTLGWCELDLGTITVEEKTLGTQRWTGRIEAYHLYGAVNLDIDVIELMPTELYAEVRATYAYQPGVQVAGDDFGSLASPNALNGRTASGGGGSWVTSGSSGDFLGSGVAPGSVIRTTGSDTAHRYAILGTTNYTNVEVQVTISGPTGLGGAEQSAVARWTDANNHLRAMVSAFETVEIQRVIGGTPVTIAGPISTGGASGTAMIRLIVFSTGRGIAQILNTSGAVLATLAFTDTSLATGGTLQTGKPGFADYHPASIQGTRHNDNFSVSTPAAEPIALYASQSIELRHDQTLREDSTGTYWGPPPSHRGSRVLLGPAGTRGRKNRLAVMARRNDIRTDTDDQIADSTTVQVAYVPRYLVAPR